MERNKNSLNPFNNPDLNGMFVDHFPKYVRYGAVGAIAIGALIWAHSRFSKIPAEIEHPQDQSRPHDEAA